MTDDVPDGARRVMGGALVALGALTVAVGVGLFPHLIDDGLSAVSVTSVLLIVLGLAGVVVGATHLLFGVHRSGRVGGGIGVALFTVVAVWVVAIPVAATNVPPDEVGATPADVGLDARSVTLTTDDGVDLAAWFVPGVRSGGVVVLHGAGSTRSDVLDQASVLARNGFAVLLVDARGHGDSDGTAMDFGWYGDLDVGAATDFLERQPDIDRIGLLGLSMGGEEAVGAAAEVAAVDAVVAEGATARTAADKEWLSDAYGWRGRLQEQFEKVQYGITDLLTDAGPPTQLRRAVEQATGTEFLLITAGEVADEAHAAEHMRSAAPDRVTVWTIDGAGHTGGLVTVPDEWEDRVIGFFDEHLSS